MLKNKTLLLLGLLVLITLDGFTYDYTEALAKSIYFYECQQAGPLPVWNRVEWRGDATMNDEVWGGWYDAGDHVKFNLPMAYSASMLGWGAYEYGSNNDLNNNLKFVLNYLAACAGDSYVYQIGSGNPDHSWWGPVEVIHKKSGAGDRPSYTSSSGISAVMGQTAAALAIGYLLFRDENYLNKALSLFSQADADRSDVNYTAANGFYDSWSGPIDECMWAALWLYCATNDSTYLEKAESYVPLLNRQGQSDDIEYQWAQCWDDSHYGAMLMLAKITGKQEYKDFIHMNLDWWVSNGANGFTPGGLSWLEQWGCLRYASTQAYLALVYADWPGSDSSKATSYAQWAKTQIDYILGSNERNGSYMVGYGSASPEHPHHRTAHGSWADSQSIPENNRHVLYGALVGGPDQSGSYTDTIGDYIYNEVACDYNAGLTAALLKLGNPGRANFVPPPEVRDDEFFTEACINSSGAMYTEYKLLINNRSGWPARLISDLRFRVFFNLSEMINTGYGPEDISIVTNYAEFPITLSPVILFNDTHYYIEGVFEDGTDIYPGGQSEFSGEIQLMISAPVNTIFWDSSNDWSAQGLTSTLIKTKNVPLYSGSTLIWGLEEPSGIMEPTPQPAPTPDTTEEPTSIPTATPEGTPVETPDPTPTNPDQAGEVKIQYRCSEPADSASKINPYVNIVNESSESVDLANLSLRYYYIKEGTAAEEFHVEYAQIGSGNINGIINTGYLEVSFASGAGIVLAGGQSGEIQLRINKTDWSQYDQTNDYSFDPGFTEFADYLLITLYAHNILIWGTEPGASSTTTEPTGEPTIVPIQVPTAAPTVEPTSAPTSEPPYIIGDVNEDNVIDIVDTLLVAQFYVGLNPDSFTAQLEAGDVNIDGLVDIVDALLIAQYYVGIQSQLPPI